MATFAYIPNGWDWKRWKLMQNRVFINHIFIFISKSAHDWLHFLFAPIRFYNLFSGLISYVCVDVWL